MPPEAVPQGEEVSVVIPAYRAAATIGRALESVARQTVRPGRVIVVDDGSDDGTEAAARDAAARLEGLPVTVLRQANAGPGAARNKALREAGGRYVAFLDADDEWLPEKLERSLGRLAETGADLVAHDYVMVGAEGERPVACARHFAAGGDAFARYVLRGFIATSTVVARLDVLRAAGGFDPALPSGQDYELWLVVMGTPGVRVEVFPEALTRYHVSPQGITSRVELRRACALRILHRHVHRLKGRRRGALALAWLRTLIIHVQAAVAHGARRHYGRALCACARTPASLLATARALTRAPAERPDFLSQG